MNLPDSIKLANQLISTADFPLLSVIRDHERGPHGIGAPIKRGRHLPHLPTLASLSPAKTTAACKRLAGAGLVQSTLHPNFPALTMWKTTQSGRDALTQAGVPYWPKLFSLGSGGSPGLDYWETLTDDQVEQAIAAVASMRSLLWAVADATVPYFTQTYTQAGFAAPAASTHTGPFALSLLAALRTTLAAEVPELNQMLWSHVALEDTLKDRLVGGKPLAFADFDAFFGVDESLLRFREDLGLVRTFRAPADNDAAFMANMFGDLNSMLHGD